MFERCVPVCIVGPMFWSITSSTKARLLAFGLSSVPACTIVGQISVEGSVLSRMTHLAVFVCAPPPWTATQLLIGSDKDAAVSSWLT